MAEFLKEDPVFIQYIIKSNHQFNVDNCSFPSDHWVYDMAKDASNYYRFDNPMVNLTGSEIIITDYATRQEAIDAWYATLGTIRDGIKCYYQLWNGSAYVYGDTTNMETFKALLETYNSAVDARWVQVYEQTETHISQCEGGIYYRYDDTADKIYIVWGGTTTDEIEIASSITNQADIKTFFESIYNVGTWDFAYNTSSGYICVIYKGTGTGEWNYSTELEEQINLFDAASAYIVSRYPVSFKRNFF